jgi:predicted aconitase
MTGTGSDAGLKEHDPEKPFKMKLTKEEKDILNGSKGEVMAKVLKTIVMHGELFGAERLADCGGAPHSSLYTGSPWVEPVLEMFEEIADAGLKAHAPYTVNPMPIDLYSIGQDPVKRNMMLEGYPLQGRLIQVHTRLGARPLDVWSCACYLPEVDNTAEPGTVVSWAESSAVNYGNSVLGMRINRMATGMEVLCAIAGKIPVFGVLTNEGRKAKWHIEVKLSKEPHWGALGGAVGTKVVEQIPYITGIEKWIGMKDGKPDLVAMGKLKAFGSSTASSGAVGLYHVEKVTPEAQKQGRKLLAKGYQTYVIDDKEMKRVLDSFKNRWKDPNGDQYLQRGTLLGEEDRLRSQGKGAEKGRHPGYHGLPHRGEEQTAVRASGPPQRRTPCWRTPYHHLHSSIPGAQGYGGTRAWRDQLE